MINNNLSKKLVELSETQMEIFLIMEIKMQKETFILVNLYGPNDDKPSFYQNLKQKIEEFENDNIMICGVWKMIEEDTDFCVRS